MELKTAINRGAFDVFTPFNPRRLETVPDEANLNIQCGKGLTTIGFANPSDCDPSKTFKNFSPKVGLEFQATPGTLFYASVSRGFKSGTYNFRSEEHTSELQSLMRISYAVFCLKRKTT